MKIGELSEITGVSIPTIRLYERDGLISRAERTDGKFRVFSDDQRRRLDFIKRVRNLGFALEEVKALLSLPLDGGDRKKLIEHVRTEILKRQRDLARLDDHLRSCLLDGRQFDGVENTFDIG